MTAAHLSDAALDSYELSPMQQGMLFHAISARNSGVDIEQIVMTLHEALDITAFVQAWQAVIDRHTILRTRFRWEDTDEPRQEIMAAASLPLTQVDWSDLASSVAEDLFEQRLRADRHEDFDLATAPMMRLFVARLAEDNHRMLWTFHHALLDGRSFPIVLREVFTYYEASITGQSISLAAPVPFRRYIEWRRSGISPGSASFWREALRGFSAATAFRVDRIDLDSRRGFDVRQTRLSALLTARLRTAAKAAEVTLNTLLQAAWAVLLHRYSGESDIVFGATRAGRGIDVADSQSLVGLFINSLPVRVTVEDDAEIIPWLQRMRAQQQAVRPYEHLSLATVQSLGVVPRGMPLFESLVVYEHSTLDAQLRALGGNWLRRRFEYIGRTNFPLSVIAYGDDEMLIRLEYSGQRFSDSAIERMLGHLISLLTDLATGTMTRLGELRMVTAAERAELLSEGMELKRVEASGTLYERFAQQVAVHQSQTALVAFDNDGSRIELSYAELDERAGRVATALRTRGVGPGQIVGLRTERNAELVIGLLGIVRAGAAYLPLDPVYPPERIAFMLSDAAVHLVLTQRSLVSDLSALPIQLLCLDEQARWEDPPSSTATAAPSSSDLAYVIYTSGSTGKPKGVRITHRNVLRLFSATDPWFGFNEHDVWTLFHSYAFDFSVWELWGALLYGGRVVVVSLDTSRNPEAFRELLVREAVTVLNQTPTAFRQLIDIDSALPPAALTLRYVIFGGEALELQSLKPWFDRYGDTTPRLINMYGITETTVHVTYRPLSRADLTAHRGSVIGEPIPDLRVYLLDAQAQPVPLGVPGEMYVAGAGVALGYLNRPDLTAQRFVPNPFLPDPTARMYRSGDLARRLDNGELEYLGRIDSQVKIRGFRIELGEIEAVIARHPAVRQVAVIDREEAPGEKRLVAYLVAPSDPALIPELRERLRRALPDYMTPAHFLVVPALPLTPNGKLDRKALPAPEVARADGSKPFNAPRNATEQAIADVWKAVLRVDRVGIDDHFFELGGDSILSIQVIARCRQQGLRLTPKDLFKSPTIAQLAQLVTAVPSSQAASAEPLSGTVPLTPIQQWFFAQRFAHVHHWNQAFLFEVAADFDPAAFELALGHIVRHHDALRLRYEQHGNEWIQRYGRADVPVVERVDLTHVATDRQAAAITEHCAHAQALLDLANGPLLCVVHFALGTATRGRLLLAIHHLVVDGVSWHVLREDLESAYLAITTGVVPKLADKTASMQVWAQRLNEYAQTAGIRSAFAYWQTAIQVRPAEVPPDSPPLTRSTQAEMQFVVRLSEAETRALLQQLPVVFRTQINDVLLFALVSSLQHGIGGDTFRLDMEGHGREHLADDIDVSRTVGWFTTLFPVALKIVPGSDTLGALLAVRDQLRKVPHRGLSYGLLRYASADAEIRNALAATHPASLVFNYLGQFDAVVADSTMFTFAAESTGPWRSPAARRTHALEIIGIVRDGCLEIEWHYDGSIHRERTIARIANEMMAVLRKLLALAAAAPLVPFTPADFPLAKLDPARLAKLLPRYPQVQDIYALTPMQRLFFAMEASQSNLGFEQWHFRLDGALDTQRLRRAIEYVISRHSILRTAFVADGGAEPVQIVSRSATLPWSEEDWRTYLPTDQATRIAALLQSDSKAGFDLAQAPAMRVALRRVADTSWHFVWSTHHLCIDGWSWPVVFKDVSRAYAALESGSEPNGTDLTQAASSGCKEESFHGEHGDKKTPKKSALLPTPCSPCTPWRFFSSGSGIPTHPNAVPLGSEPALEPATPFRDYVEWLATSAPRSENFWKDELRGFVAPTPFRLSLATLDTAASNPFSEMTVTLQPEDTAALQALARKEQVTLSVIVNAAWALLLSHYSASSTVVLGAAFSGRPAEVRGIESMVGPCVNNVPMRIDIVVDDALGSWLTRLQQRQFEIAQHQYAPLEQIQQWANIPWRYRLFDSLVVFQNYQVDEEARCIGTAARTTLLAAPEATNYALTLTVTMQEALHIRFIYQPTAVATADVQQFAANLEIVLGAMAHPGAITLATLLSQLPQELRGKANELLAARSPARTAYSAPTNEAERVIAAVWQELFGVEGVSLDDNFFELGGHSLLLLRAHVHLQERLRIDIPIVALLQYPTIRTLARHLTEGPSGGPAPQAAIDRAQKQREAQLRRRMLAGRG